MTPQNSEQEEDREERELSVMLAVDVSSSTITGTRKRLREQLIAQTGAVLTLIALQNNDNVGLVTYSDKLETYHPARKARGAVWRILHEVLDPNRQGQTTDISGLCRFLSRVLKRRAIVFLLSDFADNDFQQELTLLSKRHDVTAISVSDPFDFELPDSGLLALQDAETGKSFTIDSSHRKIRELYATRARKAHEKLSKCFISSNVSWLPLQTDSDYMRELRRYFHFRQQRYRA